jgi:hypothetical protein
MNTEQQTTQNKQHRYTQVNTDIHKTTQIYTRQHRYTQVENITIQVSKPVLYLRRATSGLSSYTDVLYVCMSLRHDTKTVTCSPDANNVLSQLPYRWSVLAHRRSPCCSGNFSDGAVVRVV